MNRCIGTRSRAARSLLVQCFQWVMFFSLISSCCTSHAQSPEGFSWTDLHADTDTVATVTKALDGEKYTALREIAVVGEDALVITSTRQNPTAKPEQDHFTAYSVGVKDAAEKPVALISGTNLRFRDWLRFARDGDTELVATYDDCADCRATTFLTAFYIDSKTKKWKARWPRDVAGAPLFSATPGNPGETDQAYALMVGADGLAVLATWSHFQKKKGVPGEDYLFEYDVDPATGLERVRPIAGNEAGPLKARLCKAEGGVLEIASGQDTQSCSQLAHAAAPRTTKHSHHHRVYTKPLVGESDPSKPHR